MQKSKLKYTEYYVVFQEVPNEVSLAFNISGCPHKCEGCHSPHLWEDIGTILEDDIEKIIEKYNGMITCVCFMGGDQNMENLKTLLFLVKDKYKLKTCVYSGNDNNVFTDMIHLIDYLKIGSYKSNLGGLNSPQTNQKFYNIENAKMIDKTYLFNNKEVKN